MRTFTYVSGEDRKFVTLEVLGSRIVVVDKKADGSTVRKEKELKSEREAQAGCDQMARELLKRGWVERTGSSRASVAAAPATASVANAQASKPARQKSAKRGLDDADLNLSRVLAEDDGAGESAEPVLPRLTTVPGATPAAEAEPKKKAGAKKKKKRRKKSGSEDGLDKRVIAGAGLVGAAVLGLVLFLVYDTFLKPASIIGTWRGSRIEYEVSKSLTHTKYQLVLDDQKRASLTLQDDYTSTGTYRVEGDVLKLTLKDDDGDTSEVSYKISLGHSTLDLFDPSSGKKAVQLVRQSAPPAVGGGKPAPAAPPKDLAAGDGKADAAADAKLVSVSFSPKDGAFKLLHPPGWTPETGSRPDNTYSWARFTKGSGKIQVFADVQGSLMSGSDSHHGNDEEGSVGAPVHTAHMLYKKTASEEYSDYQESEPTLFKGSRLGEGRIAAFTAAGGGLFGGKIRGYRVTLLTSNRRISILCECPDKEFESYKPTFLALCRSLSL